MPRLNRYAKKGTDALEAVEDKKQQKHILAAYKATQGFVMVACIAMGLLQICALRFQNVIYKSPFRWLRTKIPDKTVFDFLKEHNTTYFKVENDFILDKISRENDELRKFYGDYVDFLNSDVFDMSDVNSFEELKRHLSDTSEILKNRAQADKQKSIADGKMMSKYPNSIHSFNGNA